MAEILFGKTNPSGKLPVSFEKKWADNPVFNSYYDPNNDKHVAYTEGLMVGYRYYDTKNVEPLYPFGYGLSYTTFDYSNLQVTPAETDNPNTVEVSFDVTNSGGMAGAEVAQLYIGEPNAKVERPNKELKGFSKVFLNPGETKTVTLKLDSASFSYFKENKAAFGYDADNFEIHVGASSKDIRLNGSLTLIKKDNTNPEIVSLSPANNSDQVQKLDTFKMSFSEPVYFNYDKQIRIKDYATGSLVENVNSSTVKGKGSTILSFNNSVQLKNGVRYYIEMEDSTFLDYSDNPCKGILDKEQWNFIVHITGTEDMINQKVDLIVYPNPANNKIIMENFPEHPQSSNVDLLDLTGRKIDSFILPANQTRYEYNSSALKSGIYFIRILSPSGYLLKQIVIE